jgi:hypothetical protein
MFLLSVTLICILKNVYFFFNIELFKNNFNLLYNKMYSDQIIQQIISYEKNCVSNTQNIKQFEDSV